jgi:hypothetical protein
MGRSMVGRIPSTERLYFLGLILTMRVYYGHHLILYCHTDQRHRNQRYFGLEATTTPIYRPRNLVCGSTSQLTVCSWFLGDRHPCLKVWLLLVTRRNVTAKWLQNHGESQLAGVFEAGELVLLSWRKTSDWVEALARSMASLSRAHWLHWVKVGDKTWQNRAMVEMNKHGRSEFLVGIWFLKDDWLNCLEFGGGVGMWQMMELELPVALIEKPGIHFTNSVGNSRHRSHAGYKRKRLGTGTEIDGPHLVVSDICSIY